MSSDWNPAGSGFDQSNPDVQAVLSDEAGKWTYHYGDYTVPAGQYVTRFYFVGSRGSKWKSVKWKPAR